MAEAFVIYEFGNYNIQVSKALCEKKLQKGELLRKLTSFLLAHTVGI